MNIPRKQDASGLKVMQSLNDSKLSGTFVEGVVVKVKVITH